MAGADVPRLYWSEADRDLDFNDAVADPEVVEWAAVDPVPDVVAVAPGHRPDAAL